ncbi:MAG: 4-(cytidine 5'-diphospho)-2-C-methyl-D-erythritol kinase [Flavobacteriales bacterium]
MIAFPPAKINLGLDVLGKREDGFHAIRSIFYPIPLTDILEIIPAPEVSGAVLTTSGLPIPGHPQDNLCVKAHTLLAAEHGIPGVRIHLRKQIPIGAGLGGGSADGTYALRVMNTLFGLDLTDEALRNYAAALGSDCPFFLQDGAMLVTGRGEHMVPHPTDLSGQFLVLVMPDFGVATGPAYGSITPSDREDTLSDLHEHPMDAWQARAINHFESGNLEAYRQVAHIKTALQNAGAKYASMTGSGAAVYGIFEREITFTSPLPNCQIFGLQL